MMKIRFRLILLLMVLITAAGKFSSVFADSSMSVAEVNAGQGENVSLGLVLSGNTGLYASQMMLFDKASEMIPPRES